MNIKETLSRLNKEQYKAATHTYGPLLILAGAGSGKTHTLTTRVSYLLSEKVATPKEILLLTFTNAAANEMKERIKKNLENYEGDNTEQITACTYHSFCALMLRKYGRFIGVSSNFSILTPPETVTAMSFIKEDFGDRNKIKGLNTNKIIACISEHINTERTFEEIIPKKVSNSYEDIYPEVIAYIKQLKTKYDEYKKENRMLDYDDLLVKFYELLQNEEVLNKIATRYKFIMVDEYQDTNILQAKIIKLIGSKNRNITVVGDDAQSIYAFRGADVRNILSFQDTFPECITTVLKTNYRSSNEIVEFANQSFNSSNINNFDKEMIGTYTDNESKPKCVLLDTDRDELEYEFNFIKDYFYANNTVKDIAVLSRTSKESYKLELLLDKEGIPYKKLGGLKFLEHKCVIDFLNFCKIIVNPYDELAWFSVLDVLPKIGTKRSKVIACDCKRDNFIIDNPYSHLNSIKPYLNDLHNFYIELKDSDYKTQLNKIKEFYFSMAEEKVNLSRSSESSKEKQIDAIKNDKKTIKVLLEIANDYTSIKSMLDAFTLDRTPDQKKDDNALTISTIHSAKGLEFEHVFVQNCIDGIFPGESSFISQDEFQESLRLWYVAITRAKKRLYLMVPGSILFHGEYIPGTANIFIRNIEDKTVYQNLRVGSITHHLRLFYNC